MRLVLAEDSVLLREGIARLLAEQGIDVVAQASTADELLSAVEEHKPDVVITDIKMPPSHTDDGLRAAEWIKDRFPDIGILVLSQYVEPRYAMKLMTSGGGVGYLLKDRVARVGEFIQSIERVAAGDSVVDPQVVSQLMDRRRSQIALERLTDREKEILARMAQGKSNKAISDELVLGPKTVETHITHILQKLELAPSTEGHRRVLAVLDYLRSA